MERDSSSSTTTSTSSTVVPGPLSPTTSKLEKTAAETDCREAGCAGEEARGGRAEATAETKEMLPPPAWLTAAVVETAPPDPLPLPSPDPVESAPELGAGDTGDAVPA